MNPSTTQEQQTTAPVAESQLIASIWAGSRRIELRAPTESSRLVDVRSCWALASDRTTLRHISVGLREPEVRALRDALDGILAQSNKAAPAPTVKQQRPAQPSAPAEGQARRHTRANDMAVRPRGTPPASWLEVVAPKEAP